MIKKDVVVAWILILALLALLILIGLSMDGVYTPIGSEAIFTEVVR
jgi:hypothetical protein